MDLGTEMSDQLVVGPAEARGLLGQVEAIHFTPFMVVSRKVADFLASDASDASPHIKRPRGRARDRTREKGGRVRCVRNGVGQAPYRGSSV
jgi:hypothetical protein